MLALQWVVDMTVGITALSVRHLGSDLMRETPTRKPNSAIAGGLVGLLIIGWALLSALVWLLSKP